MHSIIKVFFLLFCAITIIACSKQNKNCSKFKTGTFKYVDPNSITYTITRNDSLQIEVNNKNNIKVISTIEWISDCEYKLKYKDIINYLNKREVIGKVINIEIIETKTSAYICNIKSDALDSTIKITKMD